MNLLEKNNALTSIGAYQFAQNKLNKIYQGKKRPKGTFRIDIENIRKSIAKGNGDDCMIYLFESNRSNESPIMMVKYPDNQIAMFHLGKKSYEIAKKEQSDYIGLWLMNGRFLYEKALLKGEANLPLINVTGLV